MFSNFNLKKKMEKVITNRSCSFIAGDTKGCSISFVKLSAIPMSSVFVITGNI